MALPQSRGGARFCTRGAMQGYDIVLFIVALATGAGAGRGASHKTASLVTQLSRHGAAIAYTDLLGLVILTNHLII